MLEFTGSSDAAKCSALVDSLMGFDVECLLPINEHRKFWGIANYFYIPNGLGLIEWNEEKALTPKSVKDAAE